MSASREKQARQEQVEAGLTDAKTIREAEQRTKEKRSNLLYGIIAIVFVAAIAVTLIWRSNIIQRSAAAVTVDGEKYTASEVNFYYRNVYLGFMSNASYYGYLNYLGLDTTSSMKTQTISESAANMTAMLGLQTAEAGQTWYDYFLGQALDQLTAVQNALKAAEAEGYVYPASIEAEHADYMEDLKASAEANGISVKQYLAENFGPNVTEKVYSEQLLRMLKFDNYSNHYISNLSYSDSELEAIYNESPSSYDKVSYEAVAIDGRAESTTDADGNTVEPTEEETAAAKEAAKKTADEMLADYKAGKDLETLAKADEDKFTYASNEKTAYYSGDVLYDWLFDDARKDGDTAVLESGSTYYVAVFRERFREEYNTIDVRHILIQPEAGTKASDEEGYEEEQAQLNADAKAIAEDLLAQWEAGEATEESFGALAMEHSVDGSKYDGGLYTQVTEGKMVDTFNDWCFDASRKSGDTGIVETPYGYHVMYFVGENMPMWQTQIAGTLMNEDYNAWVEDLYSSSTVEQRDFGMKFVG